MKNIKKYLWQNKKNKRNDRGNDTATADKNNEKDDKPSLHAYIFAEGTLRPLSLKTSFWNSLVGAETNIVHDNKMNKAVYGANGKNVLLGDYDSAKQLPPEITSFRDAVTELYPAQK